MFYTATQSTTACIAQLAIDAATSQEAISLYCELLTLTRDAGNSLRRSLESIALDIVHGLFFFATLAVWGMVELWELGRVTLRREAIAFRSALVEAVQDARPRKFLAQASEGLDIKLPGFLEQVQGLKLAMASTDAQMAKLKNRVGLS